MRVGLRGLICVGVFPTKFYPQKENSKLEEFKIKLKEAELNLELSRIEWSQGKFGPLIC